MKTTIDIHDELLARARQYARNTGRSLRAVVEEGLRQVLPAPLSSSRYRLPDLSEGRSAWLIHWQGTHGRSCAV